jgi:hypothetical protein
LGALYIGCHSDLKTLLRNAAEAEAAGHDRHIVEKQSLKGALGVGMDLLHAILPLIVFGFLVLLLLFGVRWERA